MMDQVAPIFRDEAPLPVANSLLNVLDRRVGVPVPLARVYINVEARAGLRLAGVASPGRFVVADRASPDPLFLDAFNHARLLSENDVRLLHPERPGPGARFDPGLLRPAGPHTVIARLPRNLTYVHAARGEFARAACCSERTLQVTGPAEERRNRGLLPMRRLS